MPLGSPEAEIRDQLHTNFESYTNNTVLNNFTPTGKPSKHDNYTESPIKTMKKNYQTDEYDTTNENTVRVNDTTSNKSTINVPLNDSSKPLLRKGTPKVNKISKSKVIASSFTSSNLEKAVFGNKNTTLNSKMLDDEFDDDDYDNERSNQTLLSDLPNDILSPERHTYPKDDLTKDASVSRINTSTHTILQKVELYPDLTKPLPSSPQKISTTQHIITSQSISNNPPKLLPPPPASNLRSPRLNGSPKTSKNSTSSKSNTIPATTISPVPILPKHSKDQPLEGLSSPARRIIPSDDKEQPPGLESPAKRVIPDPNEDLTQNSISSRYESSDEELPVPELSTPLAGSNNKSKRKLSSDSGDDTDVPRKILKKDTLYPSLVPNYKLNNTSIVNNSAISESDKTSTQKPLYPTLPSSNRTLEDSMTKPNGQSTTANFNLSNPRPLKSTDIKPSAKEPIVKDTTLKDKVPENTVSKDTVPKATVVISELVIEKTVDIEPVPAICTDSTTTSQAKPKSDKPPGDSDNWNQEQWKLFFQSYSKFKDQNNILRKDQIFNKDVLKFLQCDLRHIQIKINFTDEFQNEIKTGKFQRDKYVTKN